MRIANAIYRRAAALPPWQFALLIVALHVIMLLPILLRHHFDTSAFVLAGDRFVTAGQTPAPIIIRPHSDGYDGQFYYRLAIAPLQPQPTAFGITFDHPAWRMQRILLPVLAHLLAACRITLLPAAFLAINLAALGLIAQQARRLAAQYDFAFHVPFCIALWPGWLIALTHDTTELLASALLLAALAAYLRRALVTYAVLLALATLTRETAVLFAAGIAAAELWHALRLRTLRGLLPALVTGLAVLPFLIWRHLVSVICHSSPQSVGVVLNVGWPLLRWLQAFLTNLFNHRIGAAAPPRDLPMRATMLAGMAIIANVLATAARSLPRVAPGLALGWLLVLALMSVLTGPWVEPTAFLRAFSECWVAAWLLLGLARAPVPWALSLPGVFVILRNWQLCCLQTW